MTIIVRRLTVSAFLLTVVLGSAAIAAKDMVATFRAASVAKYALKREAFKTGNAELLKNEFYDRDAVVLTEGGGLIGAEAVYEGYKKILPGRKDIEIVPLRSAVSRDGTLAYEVARVQATAADPATKLPVQTILFVWRKVDKDWRVAVEMSVKGAIDLPPL